MTCMHFIGLTPSQSTNCGPTIIIFSLLSAEFLLHWIKKNKMKTARSPLSNWFIRFIKEILIITNITIIYILYYTYFTRISIAYNNNIQYLQT
ncbi:hypothetical protein SPHINGO8BC_110013 [Sphingobacterium multivorum]|uniref:Uncharacterized protein n=1 Tax=Sphingobacterium multivorum TaxID=28454 RepID=A0A653XZQ8_SPHMU|nr:hypothetical protein SPHINGO8BC_110013 [Sphingobacterium multivorum]